MVFTLLKTSHCELTPLDTFQKCWFQVGLKCLHGSIFMLWDSSFVVPSLLSYPLAQVGSFVGCLLLSLVLCCHSCFLCYLPISNSIFCCYCAPLPLACFEFSPLLMFLLLHYLSISNLFVLLWVVWSFFLSFLLFHCPPTSSFIFCLYFPSFPLCKFGNLEHYSPLHFEVLGPIVVPTFFLFLFLMCLCVHVVCMHACLVI